MLRGYRGILAALAGLAALFIALGTGAYFGSLYAPDHKNYQAESGNTGGGQDYNGPSESLPDIAGVPGPVERAIANPRPTTGQDNEKRDLAAQEASALWAFWIVLFTALSVLVTTIGTIFLYKQITLTRQAVEDTGEATEAMREANRLSRLAAEMDLRAWIRVTADVLDCKMTPLGFSMGLAIELKNFGRTPALQNWVSIRMHGRTGHAIDCDIVDTEFSDQPFGPIFPEGGHTETFQMIFSHEQINELTALTEREKSVALIIFEIEAAYSTTFDADDMCAHTTKIGYSLVLGMPGATPAVRQNWFMDNTLRRHLRLDRIWIESDEPT